MHRKTKKQFFKRKCQKFRPTLNRIKQNNDIKQGFVAPLNFKDFLEYLQRLQYLAVCFVPALFLFSTETSKSMF